MRDILTKSYRLTDVNHGCAKRFSQFVLKGVFSTECLGKNEEDNELSAQVCLITADDT